MTIGKKEPDLEGPVQAQPVPVIAPTSSIVSTAVVAPTAAARAMVDLVMVGKTIDWREVVRHHDLYVIGDLNGSGEALRANLLSTGAVEMSPDGELVPLEAAHFVFVGDIVADRSTDGLWCIQEINRFRSKVEALGGTVEVLAGNHEYLMVLYLLRETLFGQDLMSTIIKVGRGISELVKFSPTLERLLRIESMMFSLNDKIPSLEERILKKMFNRRELASEILKNMQESDDGREVLESLSIMNIGLRRDDNLIFHLPPSREMICSFLRMAEKDGVDSALAQINVTYQSGVRGRLFNDDVRAMGEDFREMERYIWNPSVYSQFTDPGEMYLEDVDPIKKRLRKLGINAFFNGHIGRERGGLTPDDNSGLIIVNCDQGAFHPDYPEAREYRSVARVTKDGSIFVGEKKLKARGRS